MNTEFVCPETGLTRRGLLQSAWGGAALVAALPAGAAAAGAKRRTVGYMLFDGVDVMDVSGPYEVFGQARSDAQNDDASALFTNCTISEKSGPIRCESGLRVTAEHTFEQHPPLDILVIPGGPGMHKQRRNREVIDWIAAEAKRAEIMAGVCTGAFLLAQAGLLQGREATTYWQDIELFQQQFPEVKVMARRRFADAGTIITSAGITAGIDMALQLVDRLHGEAVAKWTARRIEYVYWPQGKSAV